jgi:hypothetical protein
MMMGVGKLITSTVASFEPFMPLFYPRFLLVPGIRNKATGG